MYVNKNIKNQAIFSILHKNGHLRFAIVSIEKGEDMWYILIEPNERQVESNENLTLAF